jgi:hypothetical protein
LPELLERGVGIVLDETSEPLQAVVIEGGIDPTAVGPWFGRAGLASELEQSGDGRDVDGEPDGESPPGALVVVDGGQDALAEIVRQGLHGSPLERLALKRCATRE